MSDRAEPGATGHGVSFREAARFWIKLGFINFGGPAGQIAIMHEELVERRRWISNGRFLHALNFCMLLPGPEAQQLAIYVGWLLHRIRGGLLAGIAFIAPAFALMLGLSWAFVEHGDVTWVAGILAGLGAAVIGIVASAAIRIGRTTLANGLMVGVAVAAFVGIFLLHVPFPVIVLGALAIGFVGGVLRPESFAVGLGEQLERNAEVAIRDDVVAPHARPSLRRSVVIVLVGLTVWLVPIGLVAVWLGSDAIVTEMGWFFSRAALVTFGGAYAVLAYVNVAAVTTYGWLTANQMVVGLGLAETTPGPLIMVVEFVGFVGAYQHPGDLDPVVAGVLGATVVTWATFAPCFLYVFLAAPYVERLRGNRRLGSALETVGAAVVGVIANLAVTFAISTLFDEVSQREVMGGSIPWPVWSSIDPFALAVAVVSFVGLWRFRWKVVPVVLASGLAGLIVRGWLAP